MGVHCHVSRWWRVDWDPFYVIVRLTTHFYFYGKRKEEVGERWWYWNWRRKGQFICQNHIPHMHCLSCHITLESNHPSPTHYPLSANLYTDFHCIYTVYLCLSTFLDFSIFFSFFFFLKTHHSLFLLLLSSNLISPPQLRYSQFLFTLVPLFWFLNNLLIFHSPPPLLLLLCDIYQCCSHGFDSDLLWVDGLLLSSLRKSFPTVGLNSWAPPFMEGI